MLEVFRQFERMTDREPHSPEELPVAALNKARQSQRSSANRRGIEYLLTSAEFIDFWSKDDRWKKRGVGADNLVMSRFNDDGPYSKDNIFCQTQRENGKEASDRRQTQRKAD